MRLLSILLVLLSTSIHAQDEVEKAYNEQYQINIQKEYINEIYIPKDVDDAMRQLTELSNDAGRAKFLEADEELAAERLIYGIGKWMIVNWNFYEGSRLSHHLKNYGVTDPDDMAKFLIVSYHRHLRNVPLELQQRGAIFKEQDEKDQKKRNLEKKIVEGN